MSELSVLQHEYERLSTILRRLNRLIIDAADNPKSFRLRELNNEIQDKISFVEDRHNRNVHLPELEAVGIKAVLDGYNAGISENTGRIRGVPRRAE